MACTLIIMTPTFLFLNIRSLTTHKTVFEQLLKDEHVTAFALNETYLTPKHHPRIPKYQLQRHDCPRPYLRVNGGTAIGTYHTLPVQHHTFPAPHNLPEHTFATLYLRSKPITFCTIYVRPGHPIPYEFFQYTDNNFRHYLIMADINIHSRTQADIIQINNYISNVLAAKLHSLPSPHDLSVILHPMSFLAQLL